ncbi:MAG TPA: tRNA (adenosine(37)-N6)-threonylcarbamoyltransferase complex ATPase subunit type 1 TsaE [Candidatus Acidoferrales bacterium]|nr:tRNA (adenosine(37)-N6)-threonylcarbamoyltransferase complex ATPase subunit type 1 TsaE [Candidatus Acidoferrales bacterium]
MKSFAVVSSSEADTRRWGKRLGRLLEGGELIGLTGELGTGKTCFARGLAEGLDVAPDTWLRSPTFTLINEYSGRLPIYHIDLYRAAAPEEQQSLDLRDYLYCDGVAVVEWFQYLPAHEIGDHLGVRLEHLSARTRKLTFSACGERYEAIVEKLASARELKS